MADAYGSGPYERKFMQVQVLLPAPNQHNPNPNHLGPFPVGDGFGFVFWFEPYEVTHFRNGVIKRATSKPRGPKKKKG